ncbi:hypothetical protein TRVL_06044 [Trypanosoma vivax]|nr:hypothetical protein TRVL_06044 [Trypanosoma vivax]
MPASVLPFARCPCLTNKCTARTVVIATCPTLAVLRKPTLPPQVSLLMPGVFVPEHAAYTFMPDLRFSLSMMSNCPGNVSMVVFIFTRVRGFMLRYSPLEREDSVWMCAFLVVPSTGRHAACSFTYTMSLFSVVLVSAW